MLTSPYFAYEYESTWKCKNGPFSVRDLRDELDEAAEWEAC